MESQLSSIDVDRLPDDPLILKGVIRQILKVSLDLQAKLVQVEAKNRELQAEIEGLRHRLDLALKQHFGPQSEKLHDPDPSASVEPDATETPQPAVEPVEPAKPRTPRPGHGRQKLAEHLPRTRIEIDLSEPEKTCPCCGILRLCIGEEVSEQLDYHPASFFVNRFVRKKYLCRKCETHAAPEMPPQPIDKGIPGPGLLAHIITSKYADHLPLHRQEGMIARHGVELSRSTLGSWMAQAALILTPLYQRMHQRILLSQVIHVDSTGVPVLEPKQSHAHRGHLWTYIGDTKNPFAVFDYTHTNSRDGPERMLQGFEGFLQADALNVYDQLYASGTLHEVACWAHARRYFFDAQKVDSVNAKEALRRIGELYRIEDDLSKKSFEERRIIRQERSVPLLNSFYDWLESIRPGVLPKSPLRQAVEYAFTHREALMRYTTEGFLKIDNNLAERTLRAVAIGRKNWTFAGSESGAKTAAVLYSFTSSCKHLGADPFAYLRDLLVELPTLESPTEEQLDFWLVDAWKNRRDAAPSTL